ncbi:hypothetical protein [Flavobacterium sp.]|uniref:hypothetical protein n=1 Tax=Flavobacterium sp. TaxID=239 RepID=UPI0039E4AC02
MKWFKRISIGIIVGFILFFAFYRSEPINLEGQWTIKQIVLDGKSLYPEEIGSRLDMRPKIEISGWGNSMAIPTGGQDIIAHYKIADAIKGDYTVQLSSKEKSLNGDFTMKIDTIHLGSRTYKVLIELESKQTVLHFKREVRLGEWRVPGPRKGGV